MIRLTAAEKETIRQKAHKVNMRPAEYVRASAINTELKEAIKPAEMALIRKLSGVANNLNQVTKALLAEGIMQTAGQVEEMIKQIHQLLNEK